MRLTRVRFSVRWLMGLVALAALGLGLWKWMNPVLPSPQARAIELAVSTPTSSHYEAAAIYQAAMFQEQVTPGSLTKLTRLPQIKTSRIEVDTPYPLSWKVTFTDPASGTGLSSRCFFGLPTVNEFRAAARAGGL